LEVGTAEQAPQGKNLYESATDLADNVERNLLSPSQRLRLARIRQRYGSGPIVVPPNHPPRISHYERFARPRARALGPRARESGTDTDKARVVRSVQVLSFISSPSASDVGLAGRRETGATERDSEVVSTACQLAQQNSARSVAVVVYDRRYRKSERFPPTSGFTHNCIYSPPSITVRRSRRRVRLGPALRCWIKPARAGTLFKKERSATTWVACRRRTRAAPATEPYRASPEDVALQAAVCDLGTLIRRD
jgi:hypothetical protein